jgi:hypothetical protein
MLSELKTQNKPDKSTSNLGLFLTAEETVEVDTAQEQLKPIARSTTSKTWVISINTEEMVNSHIQTVPISKNYH